MARFPVVFLKEIVKLFYQNIGIVECLDTRKTKEITNFNHWIIYQRI